jgi:pre-mRNA-processing factor 17
VLYCYTVLPVAAAQVITTLNTGKLYYCGVFHPEDDKQNVLMAGCADKKIYQFDFNTGDVEQVRAV